MLLGPPLCRARAQRSGRRRTAVALAASLLLGATGAALSPGFAGASPAGELAAKQAQAARLEAQIEAAGERISQLDEDFNQTRLRITEADEGLRAAETAIEGAKAESAGLVAAVRQRAAELYVQAGSGSPMPELDATSVRELGSLGEYTTAAAERDTALVDKLADAQERLARRQASLEQAKAAAEAERRRLASQKQELQATESEHQALLGQVRGDIAELVRQEAARRAAAAERRAREAAARQQAEAEAVAEAVAPATSGASASTAAGSSSSATAAAPSTRAPDTSATSSSGGGSTAPPATDPPTTTPPADDSGGGEGGGGSAPPPSSRAAVAVQTAMAQLGKPYSYGAAGPGSFDCSGLTMYAWAAAGVSLPHSSRAQYGMLPKVSQSALQPGDLVFYGSPIHHVGMYIGGGQYVHAPHTGDVVKVSSIYRSGYAGAARPG